MATYDNLPVFKESYDLLLDLYRIGNNFSRDYRFTLGEQIKKEVLEMMIFIYGANKSFSGRKEMISRAQEKVEIIRVQLRILKDLKQLSLERFVGINEKVESVSRQLGFWSNKSQAEPRAGAAFRQGGNGSAQKPVQ